MGITNSIPFAVPDDIAWRKGDLNGSIPLDTACLNFDELKCSSKLKEVLLSDFDVNYLVSSLLQNDLDDNTLLRMVDNFRVMKSEDAEIYSTYIKRLSSSASAGLKVKSQEVLKAVDYEFEMQDSTQSFPFLVSLQKKLVVFNALYSAILREREKIILQENKRNWNKAALNSSQFSHLKAIIPLVTAGLQMLQFLPSILNGIERNNGMDVKNLIEPVFALCSSMNSLPDLDFFKSWSPKVQKKLSKLKLVDYSAVVSGSGINQSILVDETGSATNYYSTKGGYLSIKFPNTAPLPNIGWIQIGWLSSIANMEKNSYTQLKVPVTIKIMVTTIDTLTNNMTSICIGEYSPAREKDFQGSWSQFYQIDQSNVVEIVLLFSSILYLPYWDARNAAANSDGKDLSVVHSGACHIYSLDVYRKASNCGEDIVTFDMLSTLNRFQTTLYAMIPHHELSLIGIQSVLHLIRTSGSLRMLLSLVIYLWQEFPLTNYDFGAVHDVLTQLFDALEIKQKDLVTIFEKMFQHRIEVAVGWDSKLFLHSKYLKLVNEELVVNVSQSYIGAMLVSSSDETETTTEDLVADDSKEFLIWNYNMKEGVYEWEVAVDLLCYLYKEVNIGIAVLDSALDTSSSTVTVQPKAEKLWLCCISNGVLLQQGKEIGKISFDNYKEPTQTVSPPNSGSAIQADINSSTEVATIKEAEDIDIPQDTLVKYKLRLDIKKRQLILFVNDQFQAVLFENIPITGWRYPVLITTSSHKKIQLSLEEENKVQTMAEPKQKKLFLSAIRQLYAPPVSTDININMNLMKVEEAQKCIPDNFESMSPHKIATLLVEKTANLTKKLLLFKKFCLEMQRKDLLNDLEYPFCLDVSLHTMDQISQFIVLLSSSSHAVASQSTIESMIVNCLKLLELQFYSIHENIVSLQQLEMCYVDAKSAQEWECRSSVVINHSRTMLQNFLHHENKEIKFAAAQVYLIGIQILCPDVKSHLSKILEILSLFIPTTGNSSISLEQTVLLQIVLDILNSNEYLSELISTVTTLSIEDNNNMMNEFVELLQNIISTMKCLKILNDAVPNEAIDIPQVKLKKASYSFLRKLFEEYILRMHAVESEVIQLQAYSEWKQGTLYALAAKSINLLFDCATSFIEYMLSLQSTSINDPYLLDHTIETIIKTSFIGQVLQPLFYSLTIQSLPVTVLELILTSMQAYFVQVATLTGQSVTSIETEQIVGSSVMRKYDLAQGSNGGNLGGVKGWKVVKAFFEEEHNSFSVSDNGTTYTSLHSSNTCAIVNYKFSPGQKGAWEFLLDTDSLSDECSVFGAARMPLSSRCYSSSPDLWMRRSYNGYLYCNGSSGSNTMDKIHPGDLVRVEYDGEAGTLSFSVNGGDMQIAFSDITDDIYPACGSYRNGVVVKLLKVEIYTSAADEVTDEDNMTAAEYRCSSNVQWKVSDTVRSSRDGTVLQYQHTEKPNKKSKPVIVSKCITGRADRGALFGVHEWSFEFNGMGTNGMFAVGVVINHIPDENVKLASVKPAATTKQVVPSSFAWYSDGSLWVDGSRVATSYGTNCFPIKSTTTITLQINRVHGTLSFVIGGRNVGVAFGPSHFHPACSISLPPMYREESLSFGMENQSIVFPAASIFSSDQSVRIKATGCMGSLVFPLLLTLRQEGASLLGRILARLLQGSTMSKVEEGLLPWLESPLFSGGMDSDSMEEYAQTITMKTDAIVNTWSSNEPTDALKDANADMNMFLLSVAQCEHVPDNHNNTIASEEGPSVSSKVFKFYSWLEALDSESAVFKKGLQKLGIYRFPKCEFPFIACLLKHSGLAYEAFRAGSSSVEHVPLPSEGMFLLWQKVKQLRVFLRQQRQKLKDINTPITHTTSALIPEISSTANSAEEDGGSVAADVKKASFAFPNNDLLCWKECIPITLQHNGIGCKVPAVAVDSALSSLVLQVVFEMTTIFSTPSKLVVVVNEEQYKETTRVLLNQSDGFTKCLIWFDVSKMISGSDLTLDKFPTLKVKFENTTESEMILQSHQAKDHSSSGPRTFEEVCHLLVAKSQFLFCMKAAGQTVDNNSSTSSALLGLTTLYSHPSQNSSTRGAEISRRKTQDRWKRVIEFLHVQSTLRRQLSSELSQEDGQEAETNNVSSSVTKSNGGSVNSAQDEISCAQAMIQACALFISSEDNNTNSSPKVFCDILQERLKRADARLRALQSLRNLLEQSCIAQNPMVCFDLLVMVKNSIPPGSTIPSSTKTAKDDGRKQHSGHYLSHLEGCHGRVLKLIQSAFSVFYDQLANLYSHLLSEWEKNSTILTQHDDVNPFGVPFNFYIAKKFPRQEKDVAQVQQFFHPRVIYNTLNIVLKFWKLAFSSRDFEWILSSSMVATLCKMISLSSQERFERKLIAANSQMAKFLQDIPVEFYNPRNSSKSHVWAPEFVEAQISSGHLSGHMLMLHTLKAVKLQLTTAEQMKWSMDSLDYHEAALDKQNALSIASRHYSSAYIALSKQSEAITAKKKQDEIEKEAVEQKTLRENIATLSLCGIFDEAHKAAEIQLSGMNSTITLRQNQSGTSICAYATVCYTPADISTTGNYFEVTILSLGHGDIGVGLANRVTFQVRENMPGWVAHSYGYHGDDGKKFGVNSTSGDWPLFELNDVIGCGINYTTRSIFYTRNGELLGDAFTNVTEESLWPIIGFSNRHVDVEKVKINFGIEPFVYTGAEVVVNAHALAERAKRLQPTSSTTTSTAIDESKQEIVLQSTYSWKRTNFDLMSGMENGPCDHMNLDPVMALKMFDKLNRSCKNANAHWLEFMQINKMSYVILKHLLLVCSHADSRNTNISDGTISNAALNQQLHTPLKLVKEISKYGTPSSIFTAMNHDHLQKNILAAIFHELHIGTTYLLQFNNASSHLVTSSSSSSIATIEDGLLEIAAVSKADINTDSSSDGGAGLVLEVTEVEQSMKRHLSLLSTLVAGTGELVNELSQGQYIKILFSLLSLSLSNACEREIFHVLSKLIPTLDPAIVEKAIPVEWKHKLTTYEDSIASIQQRRRARSSPDSLIKFLLLEAVPAYQCAANTTSNSIGYGMGDHHIISTQLRLMLLQKLLESNLWTELVASNMIVAMRNAEAVLESLMYTKESHDILMIACAAINIIQLTPILMPGCKVEISNPNNSITTGLLIAHHKYHTTAEVVLSSNLHEFSFTKHIEVIEVSKLRPVPVATSVDFSKFSQPIIGQLSSLSKLLIEWQTKLCPTSTSATMPSSLGFSEGEKLRVRTSRVLFATLSTLLSSTSSELVVDSLLSSGILKDIISMALRPSALPFILKPNQLIDITMFFTARCLETPAAAVIGSTDQNAVVDSLNVPAVMVNESSAVEVEVISNNVSSQEKDDIVKTVASELAVSEEVCRLVLEHTNYDRVIAEPLIRSFEYTTMETAFGDKVIDSAATIPVTKMPTVADDTVIKRLQNTAASSAELENATDLFFAPPIWCVVENLLSDEKDVSKKVMEGEYVLDGSMEGNVTDDKLIGKCVKCFENANMVISYHGFDRNVMLYKPMQVTNCSKVISFYSLPPADASFVKYLTLFEMTWMNYALRSLLKRLLINGYADTVCFSNALNSSSSSAASNDMVSLIKYITITDNTNRLAESISAVCESLPAENLLSAAATSDASQELVSALVNDAERQLELSSAASLTTLQALQDDKVIASPEQTHKIVRFSSPHPFYAPIIAEGEIVIPNPKVGAMIYFHEKSCTPSERSCLKFFFNKRNFLRNQEPDKIFWGNKGDPSYFKEFPVHDVEEIFYRFEAREGSNRLPLSLKAVQGSTTSISNNEIIASVIHSDKRVGLDEDDTLFNLFDTSKLETTKAPVTVSIDCPFIRKSGKWFFEMKIDKTASSTATASASEEESGLAATTNDRAISIGVYRDGLDFSPEQPLHSLPLISCFVSDGDVISNGTVINPTGLKWQSGDIVGCLLEISETNNQFYFSFVINNQWTDVFTEDFPAAGVGGLLPLISVGGDWKCVANFGESPFLTNLATTPTDKFSITTNNQVVGIINIQENEKELAATWGYDFIVKPQSSLNIQLQTEFELIWQSKSSSKPKKYHASKKIWIWRPKAVNEFIGVGDIVTTSSFPPRRSILVSKHQCKPPKSFDCVFVSSKNNLAIWRPKAPDGYVALGDIATSTSSTASAPPTSTVLCVPLWAVTTCEFYQQVTTFKRVGEGKTLSNASLWTAQNSFGYFFGSPYEKRKSTAPRQAEFIHDGIGKGYSLKVDIESLVLVEWKEEKHVLKQPSLQWSLDLLHALLQDKSHWKSFVLKDTLFLTLIKYLRCDTSPSPLLTLPILVQMIRFAPKFNVQLPLVEVKELCSSILNEVVTVLKKNKKQEISVALIQLIDFVVEIQAMHVLESAQRDHSRMVQYSDYYEQYETSLKKEKQLKIFEQLDEPFVGYDKIVEGDESTMSQHEKGKVEGGMNVNKQEQHETRHEWWKREKVSTVDLNYHRVIKTDYLQRNVFSKESILLKLKQALKFLYSVKYDEIGKQRDLEQATKALSLHPRNFFPKILSTKVWYDDISLCQIVESLQHPYIESSLNRTVYFPGASQLTVIFDPRCALNNGDKITISTSVKSITIIATANESFLSKIYHFPGDEVVIKLEKTSADSSSSSATNSGAWGWCFLVVATGPVYENIQLQFDLSKFYHDSLQDHQITNESICDIVDNLTEIESRIEGGRLESGINVADLIPLKMEIEKVVEKGGKSTKKIKKARTERSGSYSSEDGENEVESAASSDDEDSSDAKENEEHSDGEDFDGTTTDIIIRDEDRLQQAMVDTEVVEITSTIPTNEECLIAESNLGERPVSKRAKRDVTKRTSTSDFILESDEVALIKDDIEKLIILKLGKLVKTDSIVIPHANKLQIKMNRKVSVDSKEDSEENKASSKQYTFMIELIIAEKQNVTRYKFPNAKSFEETIAGNAVEYRLWAMETNSVKEVVELFNQQKKKEQEVIESTKSDITTENSTGEIIKEQPEPAEEEQLDSDLAAAIAFSLAQETSADPSSGGPSDEIPSTVIAAHSIASSNWSCETCTFFNPMSEARCTMCFTPRPGADADAVTSPPVDEGAGWWCPVCTLINPLHAAVCNACGSNRSGEAAIPAPEEEEDEEEDGEEEEQDAAEDEEDAEAGEDLDPVEALRKLLVKKASSAAALAAAASAASTTTSIVGDEIIISIKGEFTEEAKFESRLQAALLSKGTILTPLQVLHRVSSWTKEDDDLLLSFLNDSKPTTKDKTFAESMQFTFSKHFLTYQGVQLSSKFNMLDIIMRKHCIEMFNKSLETLLPVIDLSNENPYSFGAILRKSNLYLLAKIKMPLLEKALASTAVDSESGLEVPATVQLDNYKALTSRERGLKDPSTSTNCFVQCFQQLQHKDAGLFRYIISDDRVFQINFAEESGIDAGGVFREGVTRMIEDLFSDTFNLLVLCPNGQHALHNNMDKYVPNPLHTGPLALEMFEFIGKLMAMSIRAKLCLPFQFPPLIWKKLVGEDVTKLDIAEIDMITAKRLDEIAHCHHQTGGSSAIRSTSSSIRIADIDDETVETELKEGERSSSSAAAVATAAVISSSASSASSAILNQDEFYAKFEGKFKFVYIGCDSVERELIVGGKKKEVTFENRQEYVNLVVSKKVHEFDEATAAMQRGMGKVIPLRALLLFSSKQLEELVCGSPKIDMVLWKAHTESSGLSPQTVSLFWKVMESLTNEEQTGFIRFAWGRSRLPTSKADFKVKMRLTSGGRAALPVSHTCFFSIELPEYRTEEEMRHGLLTAIHYGQAGILMG